jgi:hypothetical protein
MNLNASSVANLVSVNRCEVCDALTYTIKEYDWLSKNTRYVCHYCKKANDICKIESEIKQQQDAFLIWLNSND